MIKFIVTAVSFFFLQACATAEKAVVDPVAMYKKGMEEGNKAMVEEVQRNLKQKNAYGYVEPYYPLRLPSDIRKVWIVDHPNDAGDLIQGALGFHGGNPWSMGIAVYSCCSPGQRAREHPIRFLLSKISPCLLRLVPRAK